MLRKPMCAPLPNGNMVHYSQTGWETCSCGAVQLEGQRDTTLTEEEVALDMLAQEDGRGGHTYDTRPLGDGNRITPPRKRKYIVKHPCRWCGMSMLGGDDYHPDCLAEKHLLERYDRMEEKPVQTNPNNVGKHWTHKGGPKWNGQTTR